MENYLVRKWCDIARHRVGIDQVQHPLAEVREEKDLRILVTDDLKPSMQCTQAATFGPMSAFKALLPS